MRPLLLASLLLPTVASAQLGLPIPLPVAPPSPVSTASVDVTQDAVDRAVAAALAETRTAVQDSATIEVLDAIRESFGSDEARAEASAPEPEAPRAAPVATRRTAVQSFPVVVEGYGYEGDGFPLHSIISGRVVAAGSQRVCREGRPPVSRWLQVRLDGMPEGAPAHIVVAVQCDEWAAEHYVGRRVRIDAIKSLPEQAIRMARRDVPTSDSPLYLTDPTRVEVY